MHRFVSEPLSVPQGEWMRADLEFEGVDHSGDSFVVLLYLNQPEANEQTGREERSGFAGAFSVFGHGPCWGDEGHCDVAPPVSAFDRRPPDALTPISISLEISAGLRQVEGDEFTVTALAFLAGPEPRDEEGDVLIFDRLSLTAYA